MRTKYWIALLTVCICLCAYIYIRYITAKKNIYKVSDTTVLIDSLESKAKALEEDINKLDSIRNEKIKETLSLSNDSTLELWKELVNDTSFYGRVY